MPNVDEMFEDAKKRFKAGYFRVSYITRSRREAQLVRAALYYRAIKSGLRWNFNILGGTEVMISRGKL